MFIVLQYCSIVFQFLVPLYFPIMLSRFSLLTCRACFDRCEGIVLRSENWKTVSIFHGRFLGDMPEGHFTAENLVLF